LVEALNGTEAYMHFVPQILEKLNIPFTGGTSKSLFISTDKVFTKKMFDQFKIKTPKWLTAKNISDLNNCTSACIIKPISVDASVGLDDSSIIYDLKNFNEELKIRTEKFGECFIEEFIDGREFNISVIETENELQILPIAEIRFENYPKEKVKIVNYDAKWNEDSFEYHNTVRHFDFEKEDDQLLEELKKITIDIWNKFELNGYVRIDYRVDNQNKIYALEINVNPCISPDSGFFAACEKYGWNYTQMVETILSFPT
jgi:D-alanine-D-alanine ligase